MPKVKVCGIKSLKDALFCVASGADALGFLVGYRHKAGDEISVSTYRDIIEKLPPFTSKVLVTHLTDSIDIIPLIGEMLVDTVQLHDDLHTMHIKAIRVALPHIKIIKCVHARGSAALDKALQYAPLVDAILVDSMTTDQISNTGQAHDWKTSAVIGNTIKIPLILAGDLGPFNIRGAIQTVNPFAVDVNSGVESVHGEKNYGKVNAFIAEVKRCERF